MGWFTIEGKRIAADSLSSTAGHPPKYVLLVKPVADDGTTLVEGGRLKVSLPPGGASLTDTELRASPLHVVVDSIPASGGGLTDAELRASAVPVAVSSLPAGLATTGGQAAIIAALEAAQPRTVTGTVAVSNLPATQPVSAAALPLPAGASTGAKQDTGNASLASLDGKVTACDTTGKSTAALQTTGNASLTSIDGKTPALVGGKVPVDVTFPATQPVSIAATVPVSGPLTDAQLRAAAVPVSAAALPLPAGASTEATLALIKAKTDNLDVALSTRAVTGLTDAQLRASAVPISAAALPLPTGAATETTLAAMSAKLPATLGQKTMAAAMAVSLASDQSAVPVTAPAIAKGTQGANGFTTQDLKDAGRARVSIVFQGTGAVADALLSLVKTTNGTAAGGAVSIAVAAGKRLRITSMTFSVKANAAAAAFATFNLRCNPAGAAVIGSPSEFRVDLGNTEAVIGAARAVTIPIPDGLEFSGTEQIAVSALAQATTNILSVTLHGFEY